MDCLSLERFDQYYLAITPIEARELSMDMRASIYPHLKKEKASKLAREVNSDATKNIDMGDEVVHSTRDLADMLAGRMLSGG